MSLGPWNIHECDCQEVGGSCRLGHDEILRLRGRIAELEAAIEYASHNIDTAELRHPIALAKLRDALREGK